MVDYALSLAYNLCFHDRGNEDDDESAQWYHEPENSRNRRQICTSEPRELQ
jgi:hypothetical protein